METVVKAEGMEENNSCFFESAVRVKEEMEEVTAAEVPEAACSEECERPLLVLIPHFEEEFEEEDEDGSHVETREKCVVPDTSTAEEQCTYPDDWGHELRTEEQVAEGCDASRIPQMETPSCDDWDIHTCMHPNECQSCTGTLEDQTTCPIEHVETLLYDDSHVAETVHSDSPRRKLSRCGLCKSSYTLSNHRDLHDHNYAHALLFCACVTNLSARCSLVRRKVFCCPVCKKEYVSLKGCYRHVRKEHAVRACKVFEDSSAAIAAAYVTRSRRQSSMPENNERECIVSLEDTSRKENPRVKQFYCVNCLKWYSTSDSYQKHRCEIRYLLCPKFVCQKCGALFLSSTRLRHHEEKCVSKKQQESVPPQRRTLPVRQYANRLKK